MSIAADTSNGIDEIFQSAWLTRNNSVLAETDSIPLKDTAVDIDVTYLYSDFAVFSSLVQKVKRDVEEFIRISRISET